LAPNDAAFLAIDGGDDISVDYLTDILQFHLNPTEAFLSTQLTNGLFQTAYVAPGQTVGESLTVTVGAAGVIKFDTATFVEGDISATTDCVVHGIDEVLIPYVPCEYEAADLYTCASAADVCPEVEALFTDPGFGNPGLPIDTLPSCTLVTGEYCGCLGCQTEFNALITCVNTEYDGACKAPTCDDDSASGMVMSFFSMAVAAAAVAL
jgi:hypothetical protein